MKHFIFMKLTRPYSPQHREEATPVHRPVHEERAVRSPSPRWPYLTRNDKTFPQKTPHGPSDKVSPATAAELGISSKN